MRAPTSKLAVEQFLSGDEEGAIALLREGAPSPRADAEALNTLGTALAEMGDRSGARRAYVRATRIDETLHKPLANLAKLDKEEGDQQGARDHLERAVSNSPREPRLLRRLAEARKLVGDLRGAVDALLRVAENDPASGSEVLAAAALADAGELEGSLEVLRRSAHPSALSMRPEIASRLAKVALRESNEDRVIDALTPELAIAPNEALLAWPLGEAWAAVGDIPRAVALLERASGLRPDDAVLGSVLLATELHGGLWTPEARLARHAAWGLRFATESSSIVSRGSGPRPERLRVGFLSPDLHVNHAVFRFARAVLFGLDPNRYEVVAFDTMGRDPVHHPPGLVLHDVSKLGPDALGQKVREQGVHVLIDLAGHTSGNRIAAMGRRLAPVQATWLGYPATTGVANIDYRISDGIADPRPAADAFHVETVARLPRCAWCFPFTDLPAASARPTGPIRFGSMARAAKVSDGVLAAWSEILSRVPTSTLYLKGRGFAHERARQRVKDAVAARGIDPERLELGGHVPSIELHQRAYANVDIVLDTTPYAGTTTTCEALGSGVPVVTFAGSSHVSRVGVSLLTAVGLQDLIAPTLDDYVGTAVELASDEPRRCALRETLRERCLQSPVGDARRFARDFGTLLDAMWSGDAGK